MIEVKQISIPFAQVRTLQSVPILIFAAPAVGYVRNIFGITEYLDNNGANYSAYNTTSYCINQNLSRTLFTGDVFQHQGIAQEVAVITSGGTKVILSQTLPLYLKTSADDATGAHNMIVTTVSELKQIST